MGTVRQSDAIGIIVDAATDPMEQAEMMMGILRERGLKLRSLPRNEMLEDLHQYPTLLIVNKVDIAPAENLEILRELFGEKLEIMPISTATGEGLAELAKRLWQLLAVIRIYTKEPGKPCDKEKPYILPIGSTLEDLAQEIHRDLPDVMKFARIWGEGRFDGARVPREEELHDKDIVEIHADKIVK
jgi:ribosome-interacting GTPase 1